MLQRRGKRKSGGYTLTEIAIVLGIMGIVLGAIWAVSSSVRQQQKDNDAVTELQTVVQNILTLKQGWTLPWVNGNDITSNMITALAIPSSYINTAAPTTADNPWSLGNFRITQIAARTFRISFFLVPFRGCVALLLQGTSCQTGQSGCPIDAMTRAGAAAAIFSPTAAANWTAYTAALGWQNMSPAQAITACGLNTYPGTAANNSVEFEYSL